MDKHWQFFAQYWEERDAGVSLVMCRIALHLMALVTLLKYTGGLDQFPAFTTEYHPKGLLAIVSPGQPPAEMLRAAFIVCFGASVCAILGLCYRLSAVISLTAGVLIGGFLESATPGRWSHSLNILYIVQIAFLFAPAGDVLSLDNIIRRRMPAAIHVLGNPYRPLTRKFIYLGQFAAASMFFSAFFWKVYTSGIEWALSDNMRNILAVQYPLLGVEYPPIILWVASHQWIYKGLALGNLFCQALPMMACFAVRRPRLRAMFGVILVLETVGLLLVMRLNNLHFLFLFSFFVDWDRFFAWISTRVVWLRKRWNRWSLVWNDGTASASVRLASLVYVFLFIGVVGLTSFNPWQRHLDYKWNTYPFTAFAMYSYMHAAEPYDHHLPYERRSIAVDLLEFAGSADQETSEERLAKYRHQERYSTANSLTQLQEACSSVANHLKRRNVIYQGFQVLRTFDQVPPYPEAPHPKPVLPGLMCRMTADGVFTGMAINLKYDAKAGLDYLEVETSPDLEHVAIHAANVRYVVNMRSGPEQLPGQWKGNRFYPVEKIPKGAISFFVELPEIAGNGVFHSRLFYR